LSVTPSLTLPHQGGGESKIMPKNVTPDLDYIRKLYAPQDSLLSAIDETLHKLGIAIHIGAEEGRLLQLLIALHGAKTIVEIGTLAGYSAIWMARALPADGRLYAINKDPEHAAMAEHFFDQSDVRGRITQLQGDAHKVLPTLSAKGPFDMVFIDADKESYNDYLDWAEANVRTGGLIVADNTLLFGTMGLDMPPPGTAPKTWDSMRRFNERLADRTKYLSTIMPTQEGLTVAVKLY
jgi:predicted O-methyltransferase YrrM